MSGSSVKVTPQRFVEMQTKLHEFLSEVRKYEGSRKESYYWATFDKAALQIQQAAELLDCCPYEVLGVEPVSFCFACPLPPEKFNKESCKSFKIPV